MGERLKLVSGREPVRKFERPVGRSPAEVGLTL